MNSIKFNSVKVEPPRPDHRPAAEEQPVVVEGLNARGKGLRASQIKIGLATIMETGFGDRPVPAFLRIPGSCVFMSVSSSSLNLPAALRFAEFKRSGFWVRRGLGLARILQGRI